MTVIELKKRMKKNWDEIDMNIDKDCTCNQCYPEQQSIVRCEWAFCSYNHSGDCLTDK